MILYATIESERAKKGQGGKRLDIEVKNEAKKIIFTCEVNENGIYATTYGERAQCIDINACDLGTIEEQTKGEKQKTE